LISNFKIEYDTQSGLEFPANFSVEFNELGDALSIHFVKVLEHASLKSKDIYVIDDNTGAPGKYDLESDEVLRCNS
jgi:hypothetical protein